jgi:hypothetical protein
MSTGLIILIVLGSILLFASYCVLLTNIYYVHVRKKGYASPLLALLFPVTVLFALIAGFVGLVLSHRVDSPLFVALFIVGPVLVATTVLYLGARLLPRRARIAGARKVLFPYGGVGWVVLAAGVGQFVAVAVTSHWKMQALTQSFKLLFWIALPISFYCFYLARRSRSLSADEILNADLRAPVLYLRAFTFEEQMFVSLPSKEASKYTSYLGTTTTLTLEQYFSAAIRQFIGPFVALGNPLDYVPPEGASRTYERDENWQDRFLNLARRAACIIIQVGASQNLRWEFDALKREGLHERVFILTSPGKKPSRWNRFGAKCLRLTQWIKGVKPTMWSEFAAGLHASGYEVDATEPPPGSVISFDSEGSAVLLAFNAQAPADFVAVMLEHLQAKAAQKEPERNVVEEAPSRC